MSFTRTLESKLQIVESQERGLMGILISILSRHGKLGLSANTAAA
jgi:hypothetical protein